MRFAVLALSLFVFSACAPDKGGAPVRPKEETRPAPAPGGRSEADWGELNCQRAKNCQDPVLNQSLAGLEVFVRRDFGKTDPFRCGRALGRAWEREFGGSGFDPRLDEFLWLAIDPVTCSARAGWKKNLNEYFKNHQEYKNEIH